MAEKNNVDYLMNIGNQNEMNFVPVPFIPYNMIKEEINGLFGATLLKEMTEIIRYYNIYEKGADFVTEGSNGDYTPANLKLKKIRNLINKEARFLFCKFPDFVVDVDLPDANENKDQYKELNKQNTIMQDLVTNVLKTNSMSKKLIQAAKDCFIGKRVAVVLNFNDKGINIQFLPSLEFIYEVDDNNPDMITKFIAFYMMQEHKEKREQRIYKKKYWINEKGLCCISEGIYNGTGTLIENIMQDQETLFTYIPAYVIINDGLSGDLSGESEVNSLKGDESWFSRLGNADIDSLRKNMNAIKYAIDISPETTNKLSVAPGSFWDLQTDQNIAEYSGQGKVGTLEGDTGYSEALAKTLDRIEKEMHDQLDVPDISREQERLISQKALKAIYWPLLVRCEEKMATWRPALEFVMKTIIEGAKLYPSSYKKYIDAELPNIPYTCDVENQYPLPEDEVEEKTMDLAEVGGQTMSRKSYLKKWRSLTDNEADEELKQIALEKTMFENNFTIPEVDIDDIV